MACGRTTVARAPSCSAVRGPAPEPGRPAAIRVAQPAAWAMRAATSLVAMPPAPTAALAFAAPARASISGVTASTSPMWRAPASSLGSAV